MNTKKRPLIEVLGLPQLWPAPPGWPFLPLRRLLPDGKVEIGLMYDLFHKHGITGFSATVFLCSIFAIPYTIDDFMKLPKEVYDSPEEILAAGWVLDLT